MFFHNSCCNCQYPFKLNTCVYDNQFSCAKSVIPFHLFQFGEFVFLCDFVMLFTWNDVESVSNITLLVTFTTTTAYYWLLE